MVLLRSGMQADEERAPCEVFAKRLPVETERIAKNTATDRREGYQWGSKDLIEMGEERARAAGAEH